MEVPTHTIEDLEEEAARFSKRLVKQESKATLVTLSGDLGAGKTTFVKAVAKTLGVEDYVTSPTFVLMKMYQLPKQDSGFSRLVHIDAYRLSRKEDLAALRFEEIMQDPECVVFFEWPERIPGIEKESFMRVAISASGGPRTITYEG